MKRLTVKTVQQRLKKTFRLTKPALSRLERDPRKGVRRALVSWRRRVIRHHVKYLAFNHRFRFERLLWKKGESKVAGIDEVGYGPLAGPVVTGAVILPHDFNLIDVNDSKQLTPKKRQALYPLILDRAVDFGIGIVSNRKIDEINIYQADKLAMQQAVDQLTVRPDHLLIDARSIKTQIPQTKLYHGDARSVSIGAASIVAKVYRDHLMDKYALEYPQYGFRANAGYGTAAHLLALRKYGATPIHRRSFGPVRRLTK